MIVLKIRGVLLSPNPSGVFDAAVAHRLGRELASLGGEVVVVHGVGRAGRRALGRHRTTTVGDTDRAQRARNAITTLHRELVQVLRGARCPVESVDPDDLFVLRRGSVLDFDGEPIRSVLRRERVPLISGGVLTDRDGGYSILASDRIVEHCAALLAPERVLWATDVDGVLDPIGRVIAEIDGSAPPTAPPDVDDPTGGMSAMLEGIARLARSGHESIVFNGSDPARLRAALDGVASGGTRALATATESDSRR